MGNFGGHVFPGTFFLLEGLWWTVQVWRRYFQAEVVTADDSRPPFVSSVTFPVWTRRGLFHVESLVISCVSVTGLLVELVIVWPSGHHGITPVNLQHATLYFTFGLAFFSAAILPCFRLLPDTLTYLLFVVAFVSEYLILLNHSLGQGEVDQLMHALLSYAVLGCALTTCLEATWRGSLLVALARAFFMSLQGVWWCQTAFILNPPSSNLWGQHPPDFPDPHTTMMTLTCVFTWYMMALSGFVLVSCGLIGCYYHRQRGGRTQSGKQPEQRREADGKVLRYSLLPQREEEVL